MQKKCNSLDTDVIASSKSNGPTNHILGPLKLYICQRRRSAHQGRFTLPAWLNLAPESRLTPQVIFKKLAHLPDCYYILFKRRSLSVTRIGHGLSLHCPPITCSTVCTTNQAWPVSRPIP